MRKALLILGGLVMVAGVAAMATTRAEGQGPSADFLTSGMTSLYTVCGPHAGAGDAADAHAAGIHAAHLAQVLDLTDVQRAAIEKEIVDGCQVLAGIHTRLMAVLTPEQASRLERLHQSGHTESTLGAWLRSLHGR